MASGGEEVIKATVGYTVHAFRERLGPTGVRDLIEHRELEDEGADRLS